jgi:hypothetical protein
MAVETLGHVPGILDLTEDLWIDMGPSAVSQWGNGQQRQFHIPHPAHGDSISRLLAVPNLAVR